MASRLKRASSSPFEHIRRGCGKEGLIKRPARPHFTARQTFRSAIPCRAIVVPEPLAYERLVHEAENRLAFVLEADERAPKRHAEDESAGSINGIKRPDVVGAGINCAELLSDDAMIGKFARKAVAHDHFRAFVRRGHGIEQPAALVVGCGIGPKMRQGHTTRCIGKFVRRIEQHFQ